MATPENDVWSTLTSLGGQFISANRDVKLAQANVQTRASPSGSSDAVVANPFPGTQGAYPQAEVKPQPGAMSASVNVGWLWIAAAAALAFILIRGFR